MKATTRKRPKIGDVVEIATPQGLAYFQFTHKHPQYGALIRVLPGVYNTRPADLPALVQKPERFVAFFPLGAACNRNICQIVAEANIPEASRTFPLFKAGVKNSAGVVECWWLWDGEKEWRIGSLKSEHRDLPVRGVWNDTLLIERIID